MKRFILPAIVVALVVGAWVAGRVRSGDDPMPLLDSAQQVEDASAVGAIDTDLGRLGHDTDHVSEVSREPFGADERPLALDRSRPFALQQSDLEAAAKAGNASAALAMYHGWELCGRTHALSDADRIANAEMVVSFQRQLSEAMIAEIPDEETRDAGVDALAQVDPDEAVASVIEGAEALAQFCEGTAPLDWFDRRVTTDRWLERAAVLGDPAAMRTFVFRAFQASGQFSAVAHEMARRKPVVLDVVARGLAAGDAYMLGEMAISIGRGYYGPADAERGYAYALAYLGASHLRDDPALGGWFSQAELQARPYIAIESLRAELEAGLDAAARARAAELAPALRSACCARGRP